MKKMLIILVILLFLILSFFIKDNRNLTLPERLIKETILFVEKVIDEPINYINNNLKKIKEKNQIYIKYKILKKENDELKLELNKYVITKKELENLKANLNLKNSLINYKIIDAYIINRNIGYFYDKVIIDKGKKNSIKKDMIVINNRGLVGKIIKVTNHTSTVKLITSPIKIGVIINEQFGLLTDYQNGYFVIEGINEAKKGDLVTTLGMDKIPNNIIIGHVEKILTDKFNLTKKVYVKPSVNYSNLDYVMVLEV